MYFIDKVVAGFERIDKFYCVKCYQKHHMLQRNYLWKEESIDVANFIALF